MTGIIENEIVEAALAYAKAGYPVFPLHTPRIGVRSSPWMDQSDEVSCSCGDPGCRSIGKHPRVSGGFQGATTDCDAITEWWTQWPDANIGLVTGARSGLLICDVDDPEAAPGYFKGEWIAECPAQSTSAGRYQVVYAYGGDPVIPSGTQRWPGVDVRCEGGYVVAPPSMHPTGTRYSWVRSPSEWEPQEPPEEVLWPLIEAGRARAAFPEVEVVHEDDEAPLSLESDCVYEQVGEILQIIPSDDHDTWWRVGMALRSGDHGNRGWELFDEWSQRTTAGNYSATENAKRWASFRPQRPGRTSLSLATVYHLAAEHGWMPGSADVLSPNGVGPRQEAVKAPGIDEEGDGWGGSTKGEKVQEEGEEEASREDEGAATVPGDDVARIVEGGRGLDSITIEPLPPELVSPAGLGVLGTVYSWIEASAIESRPALSMAAALSMISAIVSRRYRTQRGSKPVLYTVGVAPTGAGKDHARVCVQNILRLTAVPRLIHMIEAGVASGQAVMEVLERNGGSRLLQIDEFGLYLRAATDKRAGAHLQKIVSKMLEAYSACKGMLRSEARVNQKINRQIVLHEPCLVIHGVATPRSFAGAITESELHGGLLGRVLMFVDPDVRELEGDVFTAGAEGGGGSSPPEEVIEAVKALDEMSARHLGELEFEDATVPANTRVVPMSENAASKASDFARRCRVTMNALDRKSDPLGALWGRTAEQAVNLGLLRAVSREPLSPVITEADVAWGIGLVTWCLRGMEALLRKHLVRDDVEARVKAMKEPVLRACANGATRSHAVRSLRHRTQNAAEAHRIVQSMILNEEIVNRGGAFPEGECFFPA